MHHEIHTPTRSWTRNVDGSGKVLRIIAVASFALGFACDAVRGDELDALKQRFKTRYPQILKWKGSGKIGETWQGKIAAISPEALKERAVADLIDAENRDREALYRELAAEAKTTPQVVAQRNAMRNFERAQDRHLVMARDNLWRSKADYARLRDYQKKGKLGESITGFLEPVQASFLSDRKLKNLMEKDNDLRRKAYEAIAKKDRKRSYEQVARQQGETNLKHAAVGYFIKKADGQWHRVEPKKRKD